MKTGMKKDEVELDFQPITASEGDYFTKIALQLGDSSTCPDLVCEDTFPAAKRRSSRLSDRPE